MAERDEVDPRSATQTSIIIAIVAAVLNGLFVFLSTAYFEDRVAIYGPVSSAHVNAVRVQFAMFSGLTAIMLIATAWRPRLVGHALAGLGGLGALAGALAAFAADMHPVLSFTLLVVGALAPVLAWKSLEGSRAAWAFLLAACGVLATVTLFGATKVRGALGVGFWLAMIIPGMFAAAATGLALARRSYREA